MGSQLLECAEPIDEPPDLVRIEPVYDVPDVITRTVGQQDSLDYLVAWPEYDPDQLFTEPEHLVWPIYPYQYLDSYRELLHERLLDSGPDSLADYEMLQVLLMMVQPYDDAVRSSAQIIEHFGSYAKVLAASPGELLNIPGGGRQAAAAIKLMQAGALRTERSNVLGKPVLGNWDCLIAYLYAVMARERVEQFRVLFIDVDGRLVADEMQCRGTINHTPVYPREVLRRAFSLQAATLILVHNHPSGDPTPSVGDVEMTLRMERILLSAGVCLHDHIIIGSGGWTSFRQDGLL